jgi:hypothetical protein
MKYKKIALFLLLCIAIFAQAIFVIYTQREKFFSHNYMTSFDIYKNKYYNSQYTKKNPKYIISDSALESFAGGVFLKGLNPILITHDHPPLGRYLVAISILLFNNQHIVILPCLFFSLIGLYFIARVVLKNIFIALIPVAVFANEPLFLEKIRITPLLEPLQLPFIIFSIYFFMKGMKSKRYLYWFMGTAVMLGFVISIRFFVTGFALIFCMIVSIIFFTKPFKMRLVTFLATLPITCVVLLLSYTRTMMDGYSVRQIIGIQKYILAYHKSKFILPFSFWDLLLFNRWHTWWGNWEISSDPKWMLLWPISMVLSIIAIILGVIKKIALINEEKFILTWILIYSIMLSTGYTSTNYFLPLIPFLYIISTSLLYKLYLRYKN